ncbi:unnamed protein product [Mytilus edulis]|uniref:MAM domain-containing protein n=1 Tax=Mytilus edulis TaxID=6550 RepID=A0A8S3THE3_MYTED|nr:unnamed protein product [Mytilus edulis]
MDIFFKNNSPYIWKKGSGSTKTKLTGPSKDHTSVSETGFYVYSDARSGKKRDVAQLTSGSIVSRPKQCLSFWYHMYGDDIGRLKVFQMNSLKGNKKRIFLKKSNQSNAWQQATIDLKNVGIYQIRFEATHGNGPKGDIALDDISIVNKKCADFISQCRSNAGACKGTTKHLKNCQHVNGTYQLAECSNIYMNIDKSSLKQVNDSLCANVSIGIFCTIDMSTFCRSAECFKRYTMKTEYECEENLQSKEDNTTTDKNNKTKTPHGGENYYTCIDPNTFEHDNEYDVLSSHKEICHPSLPDISSLATYVVLDPKETGFNRSKDYFCTYNKDDSNKLETSFLNAKIIRDETATSATNVSWIRKKQGSVGHKVYPIRTKKAMKRTEICNKISYIDTRYQEKKSIDSVSRITLQILFATNFYRLLKNII